MELAHLIQAGWGDVPQPLIPPAIRQQSQTTNRVRTLASVLASNPQELLAPGFLSWFDLQLSNADYICRRTKPDLTPRTPLAMRQMAMRLRFQPSLLER